MNYLKQITRYHKDTDFMRDDESRIALAVLAAYVIAAALFAIYYTYGN